MCSLKTFFINFFIMKTKSKTYHHPNLKEKLLEESLKEIDSKGIEGLSLRNLSKKLGVSQSAPFRHFSSKQDLLNALALKGFSLLENYIDFDIFDKNMDVFERIRQFAQGYINFVMSNQSFYKLMLNLELFHGQESEEVRKAGDKTVLHIVNIIREGQKQGVIKDDQAVFLSIYFWSTFHGLLDLFVKEHSPCSGFALKFAHLLTENELKEIAPMSFQHMAINIMLEIFIRGVKK